MSNEPKTRFDGYLRRAPFSAGALARKADMPPITVTDIRYGRKRPRQDTLERLRRAASELEHREVDICEMFDFGPDPSAATTE